MNSPESNGDASIDKDNIHQWLMAELDDEVSDAQRAEIQRWLQSDHVLQKEYEAMKRTRELTVTSRFKEPSPEVWDSYWQGVYRRVERGIGWILFSIGAIVLMFYGAWEMGRSWFTDSSIPLWIRLAGGSMVAGGTILMVSIIRERLFLHKNERYKDIQR
ncbi:MAG: hypothetical protein CMQ46_11995 [Gammaproteobacteria bacterium]|nr:hypothetical protein [Gammaproteobacteria bacterium]MBJ55969.1 hypothetical protein [Gammaproteobacteria bacterium]